MIGEHPGAVVFPLFEEEIHHRLQGFEEEAVAVQAVVVLTRFQDVQDAVNVHDIDPVRRKFLRGELKRALDAFAFFQKVDQEGIENPVRGKAVI